MKTRRFSLKKRREVVFINKLHELWVKYFTYPSVPYLRSVPMDSQLQILYTQFYIKPFDKELIQDNMEDIEASPGKTLSNLFSFNRVISPESIVFCEVLQSNECSNINTQNVIIEAFPELVKSFIIISHHVQNSINLILQNQKITTLPKYIIENLHLLTRFFFNTENVLISDILVILTPLLDLFHIVTLNNINDFFRSPISITYFNISNQILNLIGLNQFETFEIDKIIEFVIILQQFQLESENLQQIYYQSFVKFTSIAPLIRNYIEGNEKYAKILATIITEAFNVSILRSTENKSFWIDIGLSSVDLLSLLYPTLKKIGANAEPVKLLMSFILSTIAIDEKTKVTVSKTKIQTIAKKLLVNDYFSIITVKLFNFDIINSNDASSHHNIECNPSLLINSPQITSLLKKVTNLVCNNHSVSKLYVKHFLELQEKSNYAVLLYFSLLLFTTNINIFHKYIITIENWDVLMPIEVYNGQILNNFSSFLNLTEVLVKMCFSLAQECPFIIFHQIRELMMTYQPVAIQNCLILLESLYYVDKTKFVAGIGTAMIIETIIEIDLSFRSSMITKGPQQKQIDTRSCIFRFILMLIQTSSSFHYILHLEIFMDYLISLLLEYEMVDYAKELMSKMFRHAIQKKNFVRFEKIIDQCFICADDPSWQRVFETLCNTLVSELPFSYERIVNSFIQSQIYHHFIHFSLFWNGDAEASNYNSRDASTDSTNVDSSDLSLNQKDSLLLILKRVITVFTKMIVSSPQLKSSLENPNLFFTKKFIAATEKCIVDEEFLILILRFITLDDLGFEDGNKCQLKNSIAIPILLKSSIDTPYFDKTFEFLIQSTLNNTFNRYMCFQSGVFSMILSNYNKFTDTSKPIKLLTVIGQDFIRKSEFSKLIELISNSNKEISFELLKAMSDMANPTKNLTSFFHFTNDSSRFTKDEIYISKYFAVEFDYELANDSFKTDLYVQICKINSETQQILLSSKNGRLFLTLLGISGISENKLNATAVPQKWEKLKLVYSSGEFQVFINNQEKDKIQCENFEIDEEKKFSFQIYQTYGNFENIKFWNNPKSPSGEYSAQYLYKGECYNIIREEKSYSNATFNGLSVSGARNISKILPSCGGPITIISLIELVHKSDNQTEFLNFLLNIFAQLIKNNEEIFQQQNFFILLGQYLTEIESSLISIDSITNLFDIYKFMTIVDLQNEMIHNLWLRVDLWKNFDLEIKLLYINSIYPILLRLRLIDVITKFVMLLQDETDEKLYLNSWNVINNLSQSNFQHPDLKILIGLASSINRHSKYAQNLLIEIFQDDNQIIKSLIKDKGLYPFLEFFHSDSEETRLTGLVILTYLLKQYDLDPTEEILQVLQYYNNTNHTEFMNEACFAVICDANLKILLKDKKLVYNPKITMQNMIPMFAIMLQFTTNEHRTILADKFFEILSKSDFDTFTFSNWEFWIVYITLFTSNSNWVLTLTKFIQNADDLQRIINLLLLTNKQAIVYIRSLLANKFEVMQDLKMFEISLIFCIFDVTSQSGITDIYSLQDYAEHVTKKIYCMAYMNEKVSSEDEYRLTISLFMFACENNTIDFTFCGFSLSFICGLLYARLMMYNHLKCIVFAPHLVNLFNGEEHHEFSPFSFLIIQKPTNEIENSFISIEDKLIRNGSLPITMQEVYSRIGSELFIFQSKLFEKVNNDIEKYKNMLNPLFSNCKIYSIVREFISFKDSEIVSMINSERRMIQKNKQIYFSLKQEKSSKHFRMSADTDLIGRPTMYKFNFNFDIHEEASKLRDAANELNQVTRRIKVDEKFFTQEKLERSFIANFNCRMLTVKHIYSGVLYVSNDNVEFESNDQMDIIGSSQSKVVKIISFNPSNITLILKRRHLHVELGVELFLDYKSYFFIFDEKFYLEKFLELAHQLNLPKCKGIQTKSASKLFHQLQIDRKWMNGEISNYEYLYLVNIFSGRSFHDLSQYPVFPWVIADYKSFTLDLNDEKIYRDLSKPLGALDQERLDMLMEAYNDMEACDFPCIYRFHHSAPAYVISYLIRQEPYTSLHITLQGGKFDLPNRLFTSISSTWDSVSKGNSDFRELIPQFFAHGEFLLNSNNFDLGYCDDNKTIMVSDVELPEWAQGGSSMYVYINRMALESDYVSENLNKWIDLIFGINQKSSQHYNVYHPFSYNDVLEEDYAESLMSTIQNHAANFGIVPDQLFNQPSPQKISRIFTKFFNFSGKKQTEIAFSIYKSPGLAYMVQSDTKNTLTLVTKSSVVIQELSENNEIISSTNLNYKPLCSEFILTKLYRGDEIVFCPPWSVRFEIYSLRNTFSRRRGSQLHAFPITCISVSENTIVTGSSDSSVVVWDRSCYRSLISCHNAPITALDVNDSMNLIVSGDSDGNVLFSSISNSTHLRTINLQGSVTFLCISEMGVIIAVTLSNEALSTKTSTITSLDLTGKILSEYVMNGRVTFCKQFDTKHGSSFCIISFDSTSVIVVDTVTLDIIAQGPIDEEIISGCFVEESSTIFLASEKGHVFSGKLTF